MPYSECTSETGWDVIIHSQTTYSLYSKELSAGPLATGFPIGVRRPGIPGRELRDVRCEPARKSGFRLAFYRDVRRTREIARPRRIRVRLSFSKGRVLPGLPRQMLRLIFSCLQALKIQIFPLGIGAGVTFLSYALTHLLVIGLP